MSIKLVRNENYKPFIETEGYYDGTGLDEPPDFKSNDDKYWYEGIETHLRLYHHNTLSSSRRHANFVNVKWVVPHPTLKNISEASFL